MVQNNIQIIKSLLCVIQVVKIVFDDYSFKFFKIIKLIVCDYSFRFKVNIMVSDYYFNHLKKIQNMVSKLGLGLSYLFTIWNHCT